MKKNFIIIDRNSFIDRILIKLLFICDWFELFPRPNFYTVFLRLIRHDKSVTYISMLSARKVVETSVGWGEFNLNDQFVLGLEDLLQKGWKLNLLLGPPEVFLTEFSSVKQGEKQERLERILKDPSVNFFSYSNAAKDRYLECGIESHLLIWDHYPLDNWSYRWLKFFLKQNPARETSAFPIINVLVTTPINNETELGNDNLINQFIMNLGRLPGVYRVTLLNYKADYSSLQNLAVPYNVTLWPFGAKVSFLRFLLKVSRFDIGVSLSKKIIVGRVGALLHCLGIPVLGLQTDDFCVRSGCSYECVDSLVGKFREIEEKR